MRAALLVLALPFALSSIACGGGDGAGADGGGGGTVDAGFSSTMRPSKRTDILAAGDPATGEFVIFGGNEGPIVNQTPTAAFRGDTWLFDPTVGWSEIAGAGPSARGRYAVGYDPAERRVLLFGGRTRPTGQTGNYTLYADLWAFDLDDLTWTQLSNGDGGPAPRYLASGAFTTAGTFVVYGGGTNANPLALAPASDVWSHAGTTWTEVTTSGTAPSRRMFEASAYDSSRNRLVVYGGQVGDFVSAAFADLYALDLGTGAWTRLHDGVAAAPAGRFSASLAYDADGDRYLLMGGHGDPGVLNDVWAFDPTGGAWTQLSAGDTFTGGALGCLGNPREIPASYVDQDLASPERRSGGALVARAGELMVFGGVSDCSDQLDDTWSFALGTNAWTELLPATSGESCLRAGEDCQCLCL